MSAGLKATTHYIRYKFIILVKGGPRRYNRWYTNASRSHPCLDEQPHGLHLATYFLWLTTTGRSFLKPGYYVVLLLHFCYVV
jgi:hypothetical protein